MFVTCSDMSHPFHSEFYFKIIRYSKVHILLGQKKKKTVSHPRDFENPSGSQGFFLFLLLFFKVFMYGCRYIIEDLCTNGIFIQSQQKHFIEK